ncbi:glutathione S-transferase [Paraphysoderma sedebokerense]|nr:glutathione S-transferase [Paraphysoderma sedebokerense]
MSARFRLYFSRSCPYSQRVTLVLAELGLIRSIYDSDANSSEIELVHIDLFHKPQWFSKISPEGSVPCLELLHIRDPTDRNKNKVLHESTLIAEFLAEEYSYMNQLVPDSPLEKYDMNYAVAKFTSSFLPHYTKLLKAQKAEKKSSKTEKLQNGIQKINNLLESVSRGPYILGQHFSLGDILVASFIARLPILKEFREFDVPRSGEYQRFHAYVDALMKRGSVKVTTPSMDELSDAFREKEKEAKK